MVEILAPAGGEEQLVAAVRSGADAVYLGAGGFNARQSARNFGDGRLADAVAYAHVRGVKVHVTVNTLVMDRELPDLDRTVEEIAGAGADAVIIQDPAVNARFRDRCPSLARHASTQMTVHNLDGVKLAAEMGFSRVVLARELSLREIEYITARSEIETEVFIHGALCMCASGQCELSAMLGGRSGNRGRCAQPCRLDFKSRERGHALSLKDMSHLKYLRALADAGVASFKIEGRMKRPEYVAAAVTAARAALRGEEYDEESLRAVFSRSGFTDGYITGRRDGSMFGFREREDVAAAPAVLGKLAGLYRSERRSVPVDMVLTVTPEGSSLSVSDGENALSVPGPRPEPALTRPLDGESARRSLERTGGTPYLLRDLRAELSPGLTLPAAALNALRRDALEGLTALRSRPAPVPVLPARADPAVPHVPGPTRLRARFQALDQLPDGDLSLFDLVILPAGEILRRPEALDRCGDRLAAELPALLFDGEDPKLEEGLALLRDRGLKNVLCENLYGITLAKRLGLIPHGGAGLNVMNTPAIGELAALGLADVTVSTELSMPRIAALGGALPRGIVAYGYLPLMRFRTCPVRGRGGCGGCTGVSSITDRRGTPFTVLCRDRRYGTLLNCLPLHIADRPIPPLDFLTLSFTTESRQEAQRVIAEYVNRTPSPLPRTGGLYFRQIK